MVCLSCMLSGEYIFENQKKGKDKEQGEGMIAIIL